MTIFERIKRIFSKEKRLEAGNSDIKKEQSEKRGFLSAIKKSVPGIRGTQFGKTQAIQDYQQEYVQLLAERDRISGKMTKVRELLKIEPRHTKNLQEMVTELDRLDNNNRRAEEIYNKGKANQTELTQEESLMFVRLQELEKLQSEKDGLSIRILAIRQGLLNIADPDTSKIDETLKQKYSGVEEFLKHQNLEAGIHLLRAIDKTLEDIPDADLMQLMTLPMSEQMTTNSRAQQAYQKSDVIKKYIDVLRRMNMETGFSDKTNPTIPFEFSENPERKGEIRIALANEREHEFEQEQ